MNISYTGQEFQLYCDDVGAIYSQQSPVVSFGLLSSMADSPKKSTETIETIERERERERC